MIEKNGARVLVTERVQPGYINCRRQGRLPGCLFKFDNGEDQCRSGREGEPVGSNLHIVEQRGWEGGMVVSLLCVMIMYKSC